MCLTTNHSSQAARKSCAIMHSIAQHSTAQRSASPFDQEAGFLYNRPANLQLSPMWQQTVQDSAVPCYLTSGPHPAQIPACKPHQHVFRRSCIPHRDVMCHKQAMHSTGQHSVTQPSTAQEEQVSQPCKPVRLLCIVQLKSVWQQTAQVL